MYCDVLDTLEHGPLKDVCSPPLIGSSGVVPITVISLCVLYPVYNATAWHWHPII